MPEPSGLNHALAFKQGISLMRVRRIWIEATIVGSSIGLAVLFLQNLPASLSMTPRILIFLIISVALCALQFAIIITGRGKRK
jgi:hypothetical protein